MQKTRPELMTQLRALVETRRGDYVRLISKDPSRPQLRQMIREEKTFWLCPGCGNQLMLMPWNSVVDILTCNNVWCGKYRQPARNMPALEKAVTPKRKHHASN